jgi:hypothetical protein
MLERLTLVELNTHPGLSPACVHNYGSAPVSLHTPMGLGAFLFGFRDKIVVAALAAPAGTSRTTVRFLPTRQRR